MKYPWKRILAAAIVLLIVVFYGNLLFHWGIPILNTAPAPFFGGILSLVLVYCAYVGFTGDYKIWNVALGEDGRASTSKFQVLLWFAVVLFAYVSIVTARLQAGLTDPLPGIPQNLLIVLGISTVTFTVAAGITASNVSSQKEVKPKPERGMGLAPIMQTDDGMPDLGKIQLLAWTFVGIGIYLALLSSQVTATTKLLPDIDAALMALMGVGSVTYLGKKLISTATPQLASISVDSAKPGESITLKGANLGTSGRIQIGAVELQNEATSWSDTQVTFTIPATKPGGTPWEYAVAHDVWALGNTGQTVNSLKLIITDPAT